MGIWRWRSLEFVTLWKECIQFIDKRELGIHRWHPPQVTKQQSIPKGKPHFAGKNDVPFRGEKRSIYEFMSKREWLRLIVFLKILGSLELGSHPEAAVGVKSTISKFLSLVSFLPIFICPILPHPGFEYHPCAGDLHCPSQPRLSLPLQTSQILWDLESCSVHTISTFLEHVPLLYSGHLGWDIALWSDTPVLPFSYH